MIEYILIYYFIVLLLLCCQKPIDFLLTILQLSINNSSITRRSFVHGPSIIVPKKVIKNNVIIPKKCIFIDISKFNDILINYSTDY